MNTKTPDAKLLAQRNAELRRQVRKQSLTIGILQERADTLSAGFDRATEEVMRLVVDKPSLHREIVNCPDCGTGLVRTWSDGDRQRHHCNLCWHDWATAKGQP